MTAGGRLKVGITCYPSVGGSGILAAELGEELAKRGHEIHFVSYEQPFRMPVNEPRVSFHPVQINTYDLFKYPDYTLPLSVKLAEVSREHGLQVIHAHYAVPHTTAALLAGEMLPVERRPRVITTLHGTDTTLLGRDPGYGPAIRHALERSDAITTVSRYLERETRRVLGLDRPIEVIPNFFEPERPRRSREAVRAELDVGERALVLHLSNLRPIKRVDLLLETAARIRPRDSFVLVILAGGDFTPYWDSVRRLGLEDRVVVREKVIAIEDFLQAADVGLFPSDLESFCLSLLETMCFGCPSVARAVGGIPEVMVPDETGLMVPSGDPDLLARAVESLIQDPARRTKLGQAAHERARRLFSAEVIVPKYEELYRRVCAGGRATGGAKKRGPARRP